MRVALMIMGLTVALCVDAVYAQQPDKPNSLGIVNGYAMELPKPVLTKKEQETCASGQVKVEVLIDLHGRVSTAKVVSGDKGLWRSAVEAARRARFGPVFDAPTIKMRGYLVYQFPRPANCPEAKQRVFVICNINAKVVSLPVPNYPASAVFVRASGKVDVSIEIDENGKVTSAKAVNGHPFLRPAAESAALSAIFEPVVVSEKFVKAVGVITYNFLP